MVRVSRHRRGGLWSWVEALLAPRPFNVVVAAVANKLARIIWALLRRGEAYLAAAPEAAGEGLGTRSFMGCEGDASLMA